VTISPSLNLARAKPLAAASASNVCVKRGCRRLNSVPSVGTSKVTYQVWFMLTCATSASRPKADPFGEQDQFRYGLEFLYRLTLGR
jgi:hypothetical protein